MTLIVLIPYVLYTLRMENRRETVGICESNTFNRIICMQQFARRTKKTPETVIGEEGLWV